MSVIEDVIAKKLDEKDFLDWIKDNPEKLWEFLKNYIDKFVVSGDLDALQMIVDFIGKNMENHNFLMEHSQSQLKIKTMLEENLWKKLSD